MQRGDPSGNPLGNPFELGRPEANQRGEADGEGMGTIFSIMANEAARQQVQDRRPD